MFQKGSFCSEQFCVECHKDAVVIVTFILHSLVINPKDQQQTSRTDKKETLNNSDLLLVHIYWHFFTGTNK